jgi:hypothetical protein
MPRKRHRPGTLLAMATSILSWRPASSIVVTLAARCKSARAPCRARRRRRGALGAAPSNQPGTSLRSTGPGVPAGQQINRRPEPGRRAHVSRANAAGPDDRRRQLSIPSASYARARHLPVNGSLACRSLRARASVRRAERLFFPGARGPGPPLPAASRSLQLPGRARTGRRPTG